jgi:hypothetical protein
VDIPRAASAAPFFYRKWSRRLRPPLSFFGGGEGQWESELGNQDKTSWTVGLAYSHGSYQVLSDSDIDTLDIVALTARYDLAPGIDLEGMAEYHQYINDVNSTGDDHDWELGVGFNIGF